MLATLPSESLHLKHHLATSIVYSPTKSTLVTIDPTSDVAKPVSTVVKKKKVAKRKTSMSKPKAKQRAKVGSSSQHESIKDISTDSRHSLTPPAHSFGVPFGVSKTVAHTHEESPHNPPSPSQQGNASVKHSSLHPMQHTHELLRISLILLHKHDSRSLPRIPSITKFE